MQFPQKTKKTPLQRCGTGLSFNQSEGLPFSSGNSRCPSLMYATKESPQGQFRLRQRQRVGDAVGLAEKFSSIRSLTLRLEYFEPNGSRISMLTYSMNIQHAKSIISFPCPSGTCFNGDFDLSDAVSQAVGRHRKTAEGELRCEGVKPLAKDTLQPCHNLLRYKITLRYVS